MPLNWMDVSGLSFKTLLLLERVQLSWLPGWGIDGPLGVALRASPAVEWYMRHKCPDLNPWLDGVMAAARARPAAGARATRQAEVAVLKALTDLVVYAVSPEVYDAQPFLRWDNRELLDLTDFRGTTVIDVGAGTGRLALAAAPLARTVYAVEPVANLRRYVVHKARAVQLGNVFAADGLITAIPFPDGFADVTMGGHVFGDDPEAEYAEMARVTRPGGTIILCPGNNDVDNAVHGFLVGRGFAWARFEEPGDGWKRKYWKRGPWS